MKYDFSGAMKAKEGGKVLTPGIKNAEFKGVEFNSITSQSKGDTYNTLSLKLDVEGYGEYVQNFFEPQSDERTEGQWGTNASQLDHFLITVREILEAINPQIITDIDNGTIKLTGTFKQIVQKVAELTASGIGTEVQVKFIPQSNGYVSMPSYPARITKNGDLGISTRIIGHDLTLTSQEQKKIDAAKNAKPTNMAAKPSVNNILSGMSSDLNTSEEDESDLPF